MTTSIADPLVLILDNKGAETTSWNSRSPSNLLIGSRLRTRRVSYGISEEELSEQLGIDNADLDLYETGANASTLIFSFVSLSYSTWGQTTSFEITRKENCESA